MSRDRIFTLLSRKLAGETTPPELEELAELLAANPDQQRSMDLADEYWNTAPEQDKDFLEATYHLHLNRLKDLGHDLTETATNEINNNWQYLPAVSFKQKYLKKLVAACAFLIVAASLLFYIFSKDALHINSPKNPQSEISTKTGSRTKIQLPDGTVVWLNGSSKLVYNNEHFGEEIREVTLTGEGCFDVVKNPAKPFIIHTSKMDIKVLGTIFNVRCYPEERNTETSLIRGSIEVTLKNRKDKIMLKPSEKLIISDEAFATTGKATSADNAAGKGIAKDMIVLRHLTVLPQDSTIVETAWVQNRLVFSSESFEEVALKMEKWYGVVIVFADEKLKQEPLTATFKKETLQEALLALQLTTRFNFKTDNDTITLSKTKNYVKIKR